MAAEPSSMNDEIELDSKKLQVGEKIYYIDMKENKKGRFIKLVEALGFGKMSRIVVTLSIANDFVSRLKDMNVYIENHLKSDGTTSKSNLQSPPDAKLEDYPTIIYSSHLFVQNRKFYFDLREHKDGYKRLRISYVLKSKRINLGMVTEAVPSLLQILEDYIDRFSPEPSHMTRNRRYVKDDQSNKQSKKGSLVVAEKPASVQHTVFNKVYTLEVVTGEQNAFIRMTELIGRSKKSTFHVPLEGCIAWKDAIVNFVNQITPDDIAKASALRVAAEASVQGSEAKTS